MPANWWAFFVFKKCNPKELPSPLEKLPTLLVIFKDEMGRILCIDDDPVALTLLSGLLQSNAHTVVTAKSGEEGNRAAKSARAEIIICDLMMPEMDGAALHAVLSKTQPDHAERMVFCTGGAPNPRLQDFLNQDDSRPVLTKPFDQSDLDDVLAHWQGLKGP